MISHHFTSLTPSSSPPPPPPPPPLPTIFFSCGHLSCFSSCCLSLLSLQISVQQMNKELNETAEQETATRLACAAGLAEMENKNYKNAARFFTKASIEHCKCPDVSEIIVCMVRLFFFKLFCLFLNLFSNVVVCSCCLRTRWRCMVVFVLWPPTTDKTCTLTSSLAGRHSSYPGNKVEISMGTSAITQPWLITVLCSNLTPT